MTAGSEINFRIFDFHYGSSSIVYTYIIKHLMGNVNGFVVLSLVCYFRDLEFQLLAEK